MEDSKVKDYRFTWNLNKFFQSLKYVPEFRSPKVQVSASSYIQFYVIRKENQTLEIKIKKSDNLELALGGCEVSTTESQTSFITDQFSELPGWFVQWDSSLKETDNDLKIIIQIFTRDHLNSIPTLSPSDAVLLKKLSLDMKQVLNTGAFSDLTLKVGAQSFKVHKSILSARAPKLLDILDLKSNNSTSSSKKVDFLQTSVFKFILRYLYTGEFNITHTDLSMNLSTILETLELDSLKSKLYAYPNHTTVSTHMQTAVLSFVWPIENFSNLLPGTILSSAIAYPHSVREVQLKLRKESVPEADDDDDIVHVSVAVDTNCEREDYHLYLDISVMDTFGDCTTARSFTVQETAWSSVFPIRISEFTLHPSDTLSLLCKLTTRKLENEIVGSEYLSTALSNRCESVCDLFGLGDDLSSLYQSGKFSDLTVKAGARLFKVHKAILDTRSPRLFESFDIQMNPFGPGSVIVDIEPMVLHKLFQYIYSGMAAQSDCASATKLYLLAYKYDLSPLKVNCLSYIKSNITF